MSGFSRVLIMGNLVNDPVRTLTKTGNTVCNFTVVHSWKNKMDIRESVFMDVEAWGNTAEAIAKHFYKGRTIFIIGKLKTNKWIDKLGEEKSKIMVTAEAFEFAGNGPDKSLTEGFKVISKKDIGEDIL